MGWNLIVYFLVQHPNWSMLDKMAFPNVQDTGGGEGVGRGEGSTAYCLLYDVDTIMFSYDWWPCMSVELTFREDQVCRSGVLVNARQKCYKSNCSTLKTCSFWHYLSLMKVAIQYTYHISNLLVCTFSNFSRSRRHSLTFYAVICREKIVPFPVWKETILVRIVSI